jgi:hypothetical protein
MPYDLFRPGYGIVNSGVVDAMKEFGLSGILRDVDSGDRESKEKGIQHILDAVQPGSIILLHEQMEYDNFIELIETLQKS